jgi:hypothetical protein
LNSPAKKPHQMALASPIKKQIFTCKTACFKKSRQSKLCLWRMERVVLKWMGMIFFNRVGKAPGGISGIYDDGVTIGFRTRKGVQKFVKPVNNFAQLPACICSLAP